MTAVDAGLATDLRRAALSELRDLDLRASDRDLWADEAAIWDRLIATWAGLDDAAWHLPGAAPSDAGGPDWSLAEHAGHLAAWQELAVVYTPLAIETGRWPTDADYDGGDFDRFNERLREPWASMSRNDLLARFEASRAAILVEAHHLSADEIRSDDAWGWIYQVLHGHYLDHLAVIEPWTEAVRGRQIDGDPFIDDPRPADLDEFRARDAEIEADLEALLEPIPLERWERDEVTRGWTIRDHVAHLADWARECVRAIETYRRDGSWPADPEEGLDAWNERMVAASRGDGAEVTLARYRDSRAELLDAVATLTLEELRSPDGWSWAYDCLYGHVRKHTAMLGPRAAAMGWPQVPVR